MKRKKQSMMIVQSKMKLINLASSSSGNCYYVQFNNSASILIEAGLPLKEIKQKLMLHGKTLNDVDAVLITHNHLDHSKSALDLSLKEFKSVYGNSYVASDNCVLEALKQRFITSKINVYPFLVEHDADDSFGYVIQTKDEKLLFVNDCKFFKADLSDIVFDYVMIECNYQARIVHMLYDRAKKENDYQKIKRYERLLNSHMSERNCLKTLKKLNLKSCNAIFLMHLSDGHSNEFEFKSLINKELGVPTYVCKKHGGIF